MRHFDRREFLWKLPAGALLLSRLAPALPVSFPDDPAGENPPSYDVARALARDREASNQLYRHLLGFGVDSPVKGALLGWHGRAFPDPLLAGTPQGTRQAEALEEGRAQWDAFLAATGSVAGKVVNRWLRRLQGIVYLEGQGLPGCAPPELHPILEHRNMEIHPPLLPVLVGSTVDLINRDDCRDNIMSESATARFSHWFTAADQLRLQSFPRPGVVPLLCLVHPDEWGTIVVAPSPFFALTAPDGSFELPRVPPGTWRLHFWHPKLRPVQMQLQVRAAEAIAPLIKDLKSL